MPIYRANGNRYNIPDDKIQDFERRYPESKVEMYDGEGKKYAIPYQSGISSNSDMKNGRM